MSLTAVQSILDTILSVFRDTNTTTAAHTQVVEEFNRQLFNMETLWRITGQMDTDCQRSCLLK